MLGQSFRDFILTVIAATVVMPLSAGAAIYGKDDRKDIFEVPSYRPIAKVIAVAVGEGLLKVNPDGTYNYKVHDTLEKHGICHDEKFSQQPSVGICTGFLVGDRILVTAGHCTVNNGIVDHQSTAACTSIAWYFNYNLNAQGQVDLQNIPADQIYHCKQVIHAETLDFSPADQPATIPGNDFAVLELDRPVVGARPLSFASSRPLVGQSVFTIGHPFGLPAKFSGLASVIDNPKPYYFTVNLDTLGGNSGGPVFNQNNEVVGILVSGHPVDYYHDAAADCDRVNVCDESGKSCNENSVFTYLPVTNGVQQADTFLKYIPSL